MKKVIANEIGMPLGYELSVKNNCKLSAKMAISYKALNGTWTNAGWWEVPPGYDGALKHQGSRVRSNNRVFYYYAEADQGRLLWKGEQKELVNDRTVEMRKISLSPDEDGYLPLRLNCPES